MSRAEAPGSGAPDDQRYRFGAVVVDATAHTLLRAGEPQTVEPKAFAVLLVLLRRAGELVGREELLDAVWGHRHVTPGVLTRAIAQLRQALGDDFHRPVYIQTQHALGYRFIGELQTDARPATAPEVDDRAGPRPDADSTEAAPPEARPDDAASELARPGPAAAVASPDRRDTDITPPQGRRAMDHRTIRRRRWLATAALALLVAMAALAWLRDRDRAALPAEASIAVLPFTSLSNARDDRYFAEGLAVEMHDALAGVPGLEVAAARPAAKVGNGVDMKALGRRLGVATVLDASVRRDGERVRISARLTDTGSGFTLWAGSYDRQVTDVFALQSEIAKEVVQALLGKLPRGGQALVERLAPTRSIVAYDAYLKGVQQLQELGDAESPQAAIGFFRQALAADPSFARAQAGICRAEIVQFEAVRDSAAFERARAACTRASGMDPGLREVSLALGEVFRARGEWPTAIRHYTRALDDIALRPAAYVGLARTQGAQGRNALALDYFQRALKLRPGDPRIHFELGYHHYVSGNLPGAIEAFRTATTLEPDDERLWSGLGGVYLAIGDTDLAGKAFARSLAIKPNYAALSNLGALRYDAGAYPEAADLFRHAAELDPDDFRIWGNLGDALAAQSATASEALEPYRRAADLAERYVGIKADDAQALALLAWYRANLGQDRAARELLQRAEAMATEHGEVAFWGALALARMGDTAAARQRVARALAAAIPVQRIRASPLLRPLEPGAGGSSSGRVPTAWRTTPGAWRPHDHARPRGPTRRTT